MPVDKLYTARKRIKELRHIQGMSWREIAATGEFGDVSHVTLRDIERGSDPSPETCRAMGFSKTPYRTLAFRFYDDDDFERARRAVDADGDRTEWIMRQVEE